MHRGTPRQFGDRKAVFAIGIGCRKGCSSQAIVALVKRALAAAPRPGEDACLFTHAAKKDQPGLAAAAEELGFPLIFIEAEILRKASLRAAARSARVMKLFGLPSIAEAAALAGAGPSSTLLVARMSNAFASCAIAAEGKT